MDQQTTNPAPAPRPAPSTAQQDHVVLPETWPGAWGIYKTSKQAITLNWQVLLVVLILSILLNWLPSRFLGVSGQIIGFIISLPADIASIAVYLACIRGKKISLGEAFSVGIDPALYLKYLANTLLVALALFVSIILLIVPFFFVLPRLALASYFLIDKKMGPVEAMQASWRATKGHSGKVWGIIGAIVAMFLLVFTIIGAPFALYFLFMYSAATTVLYEFIGHSKPADAAAPKPAASQPPTA